MILEKVAEDPQSGNCLNISYNEFQGPIANINPTGSPFANGGGGGGGGPQGNISLNTSSRAPLPSCSHRLTHELNNYKDTNPKFFFTGV
jgi:hypothetical protein